MVTKPATHPSQRKRARSATASAKVLLAPEPPRRLWYAGAIVLAGLLAYSNSLSGPFLADDNVAIVHNAQIREWWNLARVLAPQRESPTAGRPLVNLSLAANYALGGLDVRGYHLANLALHCGCALLIFAVVYRTLASPRLRDTFGRYASDVAFCIALIWVVHPLNSEVVDYLTQRTESMMAACYLLTLYASIRAISSRPLAWSTLAVLSCASGMASKESMVTAPVMVMLYDRTFLFDSLSAAFRSRWRLYASLATTWGLLAALLRSGPRMYSAGFSTGVSSWTYLLNQCVMLPRYLRLAFWPRQLALLYGMPRALTLSAVLPSALVIVLLLALTVIALIKRPALGFAGAWVFLILAPTSSVVPIATEVGAERRMYLPLVAVVALLVVGAFWVWTRVLRARLGEFSLAFLLAFLLPFLLLSTALTAGTVTRNREYASGLLMASTAVERWPSGAAHFQVGLELAAVGRHNDAIAEYREATDTFPRARYYLGAELFDQGQLDESIRQLQQFIQEQPVLAEVIPAHLKIGRALQAQRKYADAVERFRRVLSMTPANVEAQLLLAGALSSQQAFEEAIPHYRQYLMLRPTDLSALTDLGIALSLSEKHDDEAVAVFQRVVAASPKDAVMRINLARALLLGDRIEEAVVQAQEAVALNAGDAPSRDLLGHALALQGKFEEASAQYRHALQIDPSDRQARDDLAEIQRRAARSRAAEPGGR